MQTEHHLTTAWWASGILAAGASFVIAILFFIDVFGEYFVNTSYLFAMSYSYEFTIAIVAAAVGFIVSTLTYYRNK